MMFGMLENAKLTPGCSVTRKYTENLWHSSIEYLLLSFHMLMLSLGVGCELLLSFLFCAKKRGHMSIGVGAISDK
jgi:hypothetical protein